MGNWIKLTILASYRLITGIENPRVGGSIPPLGTIFHGAEPHQK